MIHTTNVPEALFRQAMDVPLTPEGEIPARQAIQAVMNDLLARRELRHDPRLRNMLLACRLRLRALQNIVLCAREEEDFLARPCELREYAQDLCAAANLLLAPLGRQVRFSAPEEPMEVLSAPRDIAWLLLELICNSALHCPGEEIHVTLESAGAPRSRDRKRPCGVLTVECEGPLDLAALHASALRAGSGIAAMQKIAWLHRGALLWLERGGKSVAALRLSGRHGMENKSGKWLASQPYDDAPDCVELLRDPCSLVYIALAPAVGGF